MTTLHALVRCDGVGWNEVDLYGNDVRALTSPPEYLGPERVETLTRLIDQHPIVTHVAQTGDTSAAKISDFVSVRDFHRLELYADFFRPLGIGDLMAVMLTAEPVIIGIAFTRGRRSFGDRDRDLLNLLRPHLVAAYRQATARQDARDRINALERGLTGRIVVPLDGGGRISDPPPAARELLERWFQSVPSTLAPSSYDRAGARLTVRVVEGDPALLLLDERRYEPDPARARELGLTRREAQVLALAAHGLTDAEIAGELFLSPRTVAKHLEHAYAKLGVGTRYAAAARLLEH